MKFYEILARAREGAELSAAELAVLLDEPDAEAENALFTAAYAVKRQNCGNFVNLRGLIEFSNICSRDY